MSDFGDSVGLIAKKALIWAATGAVVFAALASPIAAVTGGAGWIANLFGAGVSWGFGTLIGAAINGAIICGVGGAIVGLANVPKDLKNFERDRRDDALEKRAALVSAEIEKKQIHIAQAQQPQEQLAPDVGGGIVPQNQVAK